MNKLTGYLLFMVIAFFIAPTHSAFAAPYQKSAKKHGMMKVSSKSSKSRKSSKRKRAVFTCDQYSRKTLIRKSSRFKDTINHASRKYGVSANLIRAVIAVESCFDPRAKGSLGEKGLMQLMPGTARELGVKNGYSPWQNIHGGTKYLKKLLKRYKGNKAYAAAAYNGGPGAVSTKTGPRFNQVKRYSKKVMRAYNTMSRSSSKTSKKKYSSSKSKKKLKLTKKTYRSTKKAKTYKVRSGQTLYKIAKKHRTSVSKLKRLNGLKSDKIIAGKRIRVR